jgi:type VI secretion system secreted protein VgrG
LLSALVISSLLAAPGRAEPGPTLVAAGAQPIPVVRLAGSEAISSLFRYEVELAGPPAAFATLLGKEVTVTLPLPDGSSRHFSGIVSRISQGRDGGGTFQRLEVVPTFWLLTRTARSRLLQGMTAPEIVESVLDEAGIAHESRLVGSFPSRDCVVQYRETDFQFVSRLLEEEGIFYYFRHDAGGHTMVLGNTPQGHADLQGAVPFARARSRSAPGIRDWTKVQEIRPGKVTLRDHAFQLPGEDFEVSSSIQESVVVGKVTHQLRLPESEQLEIYDYPGEYAQRFDGVDAPDAGAIAAEGQRTVEIRMQEEAARAIAVQGTSDVGRLVSGHRFTLAGHPELAGSYVLTSVQHTATRRSGSGNVFEYENRFTCIPAGLPFRPVRASPRPIVAGPQTAIVTGPAGAETHTDRFGRVKVKFQWDREGSRDESSSCWIRVATAPTGGPLLAPEVGDEVVVGYEEGDPDRPIVIGRLPNADPAP